MIWITYNDAQGRSHQRQADQNTRVLVKGRGWAGECLSSETALTVGDMVDHPVLGRVMVTEREIV